MEGKKTVGWATERGHYVRLNFRDFGYQPTNQERIKIKFLSLEFSSAFEA